MRCFLLLCLLSSVLSPLGLFAQQKPKENAEVLVGVKVAGMDVPTNGLLYFRLFEVGKPDTINTNWTGAGTGGTLTQPAGLQALMKPNRHYQAILSAAPWSYGEVKFSAPAGYSIWMDGRPATTARVLGNPFLVAYKIELRADSDSMLPAGMAQAPQVGDLVWSISAGRYSNGLSAGAVQWRASALSADLLNPTSLNYLEPDTAETATAWHSDGALLELRTFQFLLYVRRNTTAGTGYDIEIYDPYVSRTAGTGDGPYTYDDSPYRTYRISNPNGSTWNNQIKIEKIENTTETWTVTQSGSNWTVVETSGLRTITRTSTGSAPRVETVEVKDNANVVATKLQRKYQSFGWGQEEMIEETANPDATNGPALTTTYAYHTASGGGYGRLKSVTASDGSWVVYDYDSSHAGFGNLSAVLRPWQDSTGATASSATTANCYATLFSYAGERNVFNDLSAGTEAKINNVTTAKTAVSYSFPGTAPNGNPLRTETITTYTSSGATLATTRQVYNPTSASADYLGRLYFQTNPDGTKVSALRYKAYFWNYWDNNATKLVKWDPPVNNTWGEYRFSGFSTPVQDSVAVSSFDGESFSTVYMVPNRSTVQLDIFSAEGRVWFRIDYVFTGASGGVPSFEFTGMKEHGYQFGRPVAQSFVNGARESTAWINANYLSGESFNDGTYVEYTRDALGRDYLVRQWYIDASGEYPAQGMLYTHKTFDIAGRVLTAKVSSSGNAGDPGLQTTRTYNPAGLLLSETAPTGLQTTYTYANGGRTITTTFPGGATKVVNKWLDGSLKSVTGTAVVAEHHQATVNGDGTITAASYSLRAADLASPTSAPRWAKVTTDWAGRKTKEERPAPPGATPATFTKQYYYNSVGQLTKTTETALADTLVVYNAWQQAFRTGLDLNANGSLDTGGTDRITETEGIFEKDSNSAWWAKTTTKAYNVDNNATPVTTSISKQRLNKYDDHGRFFGSYVQSEVQAVDLFGNTTTKTVTVQRGSSYFATDIRLVTETINHSDSTTDEVTITRNGLLQKRQSKEGLVYRTYYDDLRRPVKTTDPRTDPNVTPARIGYHTSGTGQIGQVAWRQDTAGNQTSYAYESATGRLATETDPLGKTARYGYTTRGERHRTWGDTAYPVELGFNDYGEQVTMNTYRGGTGWTGTTWPASPGTADVTTWAYDPATGTLTSKTDAANKSVSYTYTPRGQLKTRTWARGVTTTYTYSPTTAEQTDIDYSDTTPDLTYAYNRLGQNLTIGDVTGTRTFVYSPTTTLLAREDLGAFVGNLSVSHQYDSLGRVNYLGVGGNYSFSYGYDTYGRMNQVWTFTYSYLPNSNLLSSISDTQTGYTQTRTYETTRDLLDVIETKWSTTSKAKFDYASDTLGRRTGVAKTGEMFTRYSAAGLDTAWGYNDRSELTAEVSKLGGTSTVLTGRNDAYSFDNIGNRATTAGTTHNGATADYTTNALNQYTQRTVVGTVDVAGLAPAAATVNVAGSPAGVTRHNDYYFKGLGVTNTSSAVWSSFTIDSAFGGSSLRTSFTALTAEPFAYDLDGNLTSDGRWDYTYDAENRLIKMTTRTTAYQAGAPQQKIWLYNDYLGRRVQKIVEHWNGAAWVVDSNTKFLYNGWDLIFELDALNSLAKARGYVWGLDWSGTLQGAGGVGGLINAYDYATATSQRPVYDGNGNLMALLKSTDGTFTAAYEYDALGQTLAAYGGHAAGNPFRFSTKYTDVETGLVYYGLRYYSPTLGRFLNRDPISEQGGLNLYGFCGNNGVNSWDYLGMDPIPISPIDGIPIDGPARWEYEANMAARYAQQAMQPGMFFRSDAYDFNYNYIGAAFQSWADMDARIAASNTAKHNTVVIENPDTGESRRIVIPGATQEQMDVAVGAAQASITGLLVEQTGIGDAPLFASMNLAQSFGAPTSANAAMVSREQSRHTIQTNAHTRVWDTRIAVSLGGGFVNHTIGSDRTYTLDAVAGVDAEVSVMREVSRKLFDGDPDFGLNTSVAFIGGLSMSVELDSRFQKIHSLGDSLDFGVRYFVPTSITLGWGAGFGGKLELTLPTLSKNLVDQKF